MGSRWTEEEEMGGKEGREEREEAEEKEEDSHEYELFVADYT